MKNILDSFRLDGRVAVVTGGSRGLGRAMALAFAQAGAAGVLCSRNEDEAIAAATEISRESGQPWFGTATDVTVPEQVEALRNLVLEQFSEVHVWVNNAGINIRHLIESFPVPEFDELLRINLRGTWLGCRAVAPIMKDQGQGSVINLGSVLSTTGLAERSPYAASKAAILGLTRSLALEWAPHNVRCNALCPGPFLTEINRPLAEDPEQVSAVIGKTALKRWGELAEIRGAALFLASDASSYVTGTALFVDGGWSAA